MSPSYHGIPGPGDRDVCLPATPLDDLPAPFWGRPTASWLAYPSGVPAFLAPVATLRDHRSNEPEASSGRRALPFVRFAPVRNQLYGLWKEVNGRWEAAGLSPVPDACVKGGRKVCRPFEPVKSPKPATVAE